MGDEINQDITEIYFKGTPEAIHKIIEWWKASDLKLGEDIQIVDLKPELKEVAEEKK